MVLASRHREEEPVMSPTTHKALLILVAVLAALIVALITAWLVRSTGAPIQTAILSGGGAFGGTTTLIILILDKTGALS
jgi:hypothetical protein